MSPRDIPNLLTALRVLLVLPATWLMLEHRYASALVVFGVAGLTDALDGFLARRFGWQSRLGATLDPLADKLLAVSAYLVLGAQGVLPAWLVALVLARDLVIVVGSVAYHMRVERLEASPSLLSKLNTLLQIVLVLTAMATQVAPVPSAALEGLVWAVAATTLGSGIDYVWRWGRRARRVLGGGA